ncbi:AAEL016979-PA [Aedes aegypti]|uniref:AAEL016979-PA n=1 Tax=Aedes aegypti TaxID=7159 RepID=J9HY89_AEDAE|nr:AAEL016979-PA [Aedes aegypti]
MSIEEEFTVFACGRCLRSIEQDSRILLKTIKEKVKDNLSPVEYNEFQGKIPQIRSKCDRLLEMILEEENYTETVPYRRLARRINTRLHHAEQRLQKWNSLRTDSEKLNDVESIRSVERYIQDIFNMKGSSDYFCTRQEMQNVLAQVDKAVDGIESKFGSLDPICDSLIGRVVRDKLCRSILDQLERKDVLTTWSNIRKMLIDWIATEDEIESRKVKPRQKATCYVCRKQHILLFCPEFRFMSVSERWKLVKKVKVCANCFNARHSSENCDKLFRCKSCGECHNNLLHPFKTNPFEL